MNKLSHYLLLSFLAFVILLGCKDQVQKQVNYPAPTETIVLKNSEDDEGNALSREMWIENMHLTAPGQNWRNIEYKNAKVKAANTINRQNDLVTIGDSLYTGYWDEKGSNNQAGSIIALEYLKEEDKIYCISAGGTLWKGGIDGKTWEVVNESFQFDNRTLKFITLPDGSLRLISTIARIPHFSDDKGLTWTPATGIESSGDFWSRTAYFETITLEDGDTRIYCLSKNSYSANILLYYSDDLGESYNLIDNLGEDDFDKVAICNPHGSNDILIGTPTPPAKYRLSKVNHTTASVEFQSFIDVEILPADRVILIGNYIGQDSVLYALENNSILKKSNDAGTTWTAEATANSTPWEVGYYVTPSNSSQVFYGNIEAHRKTESSFQKANIWWEYYDDVPGKIHADIMSFKEFEDTDDNPFLLIANHGGISISYDYLRTNLNISLEGLNVAQYYDVRTDPRDPNIVYAGSQDQGFQRTSLIQEPGSIDFDQVISGDYGHITFSRQGEGMWIVFPGGTISYYNNPQTGLQIDNYTIDSPDESNWLTPMTEIPGTTKNEILVAGGNINGTNGSYIIKLEYLGGIQAEQLPFNFSNVTGGSTITSIEVSPLNTDLIYVSTSDGSFFTSTDAGQTFSTAYNSINNGHYLYSTSIYASKLNENEVWIAGSGFNNDGVLYSNDFGKNFTLFSTGLPSTLVFEITANDDETQFFAATEIGPYVYLSETGAWEDLSQGNAPVHIYWSVEYIEDQEIVRFGTYGRGIWDFKFGEPINVSTHKVETIEVATLYPNPVTDMLHIKMNGQDYNAQNYTIELFDIQGQLLHQGHFENHLNMTKYPTGNYTIKINSADQLRSQIEQIIKL